MALFLIYDRNNTNPDPEKDQRGCYKRGMIVQVLDDTHHDGNLVANPIQPPWILVRVTGVTLNQVMKYMQPQLADTPNPDGVYPVVRRRLYRVLVDTIPASIRNQLIANRYVEVTLSQVRNYIENLKTGVTGD